MKNSQNLQENICVRILKKSLLFCICLYPMLVHLRNLFLLSTSVARMLLPPRWVSRQKDVKQLSINILKLTAGVKHFINCRKFSPNPHLVEEAICFPFFSTWYCLWWTEQLYASATGNYILYSSWIDLLSIFCLLPWVSQQRIIRWICSTCWKKTLKISY